MRLQKYLTERMINKSPFILSNPSLPEVRNLLTKSSYNTVRALYHNPTKKLFMWNAGEKIHYAMFEYLLQNGFIPEDTEISDMKQIIIYQEFDDQDYESIKIEAYQYKSKQAMTIVRYSSIPRLKSLFPSAKDMKL